MANCAIMHLTELLIVRETARVTKSCKIWRRYVCAERDCWSFLAALFGLALSARFTVSAENVFGITMSALGCGHLPDTCFARPPLTVTQCGCTGLLLESTASWRSSFYTGPPGQSTNYSRYRFGSTRTIIFVREKVDMMQAVIRTLVELS